MVWPHLSCCKRPWHPAPSHGGLQHVNLATVPSTRFSTRAPLAHQQLCSGACGVCRFLAIQEVCVLPLLPSSVQPQRTPPPALPEVFRIDWGIHCVGTMSSAPVLAAESLALPSTAHVRQALRRMHPPRANRRRWRGSRRQQAPPCKSTTPNHPPLREPLTCSVRRSACRCRPDLRNSAPPPWPLRTLPSCARS